MKQADSFKVLSAGPNPYLAVSRLIITHLVSDLLLHIGSQLAK